MRASLGLALLIPILDMWGGGGFGVISPRFPAFLKHGIRQLRLFGIPAILFFILPSWVSLVYAITLGAFFSINLDEIEARDWAVITFKSFVLFALLYMWCGWWACLPALWWPLGIYLSNFGIKGRKLDWAYVELLRGTLIALGVLLYANP